MADVSTYSRCIQPYAWGNPPAVFPAGTVLPSANAAVVANPQNWVGLTDGDFTPGPGDDLAVIVT